MFADQILDIVDGDNADRDELRIKSGGNNDMFPSSSWVEFFFLRLVDGGVGSRNYDTLKNDRRERGVGHHQQ